MLRMEFDNGLEGLLQRSEELTADLHGGADLPRVRRNLGQVLDAGKRLWAKTAAHGTDSHQVKAALLLGQKGLEVGEIPERLKNLNTTKNLESIEPVVHTDIEGFLRNEHENAILSGMIIKRMSSRNLIFFYLVIEEQKKRTFEEVTNRHWETRLAEWDKEKGRILNTLLGTDDTLNIGFLPFNKNKTKSQAPAGKRSLLDDNEMLYAQQVHKYNEMVVKGANSQSLIDLCTAAASRMSSQSLHAIWQMVADMTNTISLPSGKTPLQQRTDTEVKSLLIQSARSHLENAYHEFIQQTVNANLREAQRGALPGTEQVNLIYRPLSAILYASFSADSVILKHSKSKLCCVRRRRRLGNDLLLASVWPYSCGG